MSLYYVSLNNSTKPSGSSPGGGGTTASAGSGGTYKIQSGDTLSDIARQNGTTVTALASLNNISNPNLIRAGATIKTK
jgi:lysozyme